MKTPATSPPVAAFYDRSSPHDTSRPPPSGPRGERARAFEVAVIADASFRPLIERAPEMIFVHREGRILYANPAAVSGLGYDSADQIVGRNLSALVHRDELFALEARIDAMARTGEPAPPTEFRLMRRGEGPLTTELVGVPVVFGGEPAIVSIARDVTERKQLQAHLLQTDRLVALGGLAAGVAHEINNPLTYVMGNIDLVSRLMRARADRCREAELVSGPSIAEALDGLVSTLRVAYDGAERVRKIVRDLTTFSRTESPHRTLLDLRAVLEPVVRLVSNEIRQRARLVQELGDVPLVEANEARLGQVFMNLLINAAQAVPEGHAEQHEIGVTTFTDKLGRAVLEVRDSGSGIPDEAQPRIFEPFFTTRPVGVGTGLGLSICHGTITALGGEISVCSAPGLGSVFRVAIPAAVLGPRRPVGAVHAPERADEHRRARILIIDDEPMLAESLRRNLADHHVEVETRAEDALRRLLAFERFDVILCDLLMPGMTGMDLGGELARAVPEQAARVVFMTGGAFTARAKEFLARVPNARIDKPFDMDRLRALIRLMT